VLYRNDGMPIEDPNEFAQQEECAYQFLSGAVDGLADRQICRGAILMALTRLQFEQNSSMVLEMVQKMLEDGNG